ncbi:uncharacterized protein LOC143469997 [Clavelina lepadiformis]|uniref:uncharacterized protein LOC143469997 n=1 Tax=Clavelina lepadiformis TaxID=159417 RepID=UPI004041C90F
MAQAGILRHTPVHRTTSPDIKVSSYDEEEEGGINGNAIKDGSSLAPPCRKVTMESLSDGDKSDRYFTASSGDDFDYDDDDDGVCIRLDSDDDEDNQSLSGLHINLKTLQAVSSMLAHYSPVIQRDMYGNPLFIAPPPPPEDEYFNDEESAGSSITPQLYGYHDAPHSPSAQSHDSTLTGEDEFQCALQELEDALNGQDQSLLSDAMCELTDVMEKMTYFSADPVDDAVP